VDTPPPAESNQQLPSLITGRFLDARGNLLVYKVAGPKRDFSDVYHLLLGSSWPKVVVVLGSCFVVIAFVFAVLFWLGGDCIAGIRPHHLRDYFYFSVQTLATIGYGGMTPVGDYANVLVCIEAFTGMVCLAMMTGLIFSKFSVPKSRILFSHFATISKKDGRRALTFRLANSRGNHIVETTLKVTLIRAEKTLEGENLRRLHPLKLAVSETPVFALTFMATHYIDENSPLFGKTQEDMRADRSEIVVTMNGTDDVLGQTVHARFNYSADTICWGHRLADTLSTAPNGVAIVDYTKFHETIPWELD
jgi:inward rectifier potassium channel